MGRKKRRKGGFPAQINASMKKRMVSQLFVIGLTFLLLFCQIAYIAVVDGERYSLRVLSQNMGDSPAIKYKRGDIVDANGTILATSIRVYNVILNQAEIKKTTDADKMEKIIVDVKGILYELFETDPDYIDKVLDSDVLNYYYKLETEVPYAVYQKYLELLEEKYPYAKHYVLFEEDYIRNYPYGNLASAIIGHTITDDNGYDVGESGIEKTYNTMLMGSNGRRYTYYSDFERDNIVREPENGKRIVTTIDQTLQSIVEEKVKDFNDKLLNNHKTGLGTKSTAVIITDPNTGAILSSVSYPNIDLNHYGEITKNYTEEEILAMETDSDLRTELFRSLNNFVSNERFEAGSTIKPFTVAAALDSGVIEEDDTYYCNGYLQVADYKIHCANRTGHGRINVEQSLAYSCNVAMMEMAEAMGVDIFTEAQKNFGFGPSTGSDLADEKNTMGNIYTAEAMGVTDLATNSFGQNFEVTMLQMMAGTAALVNGGNYYKPYVVQRIEDDAGRIISNTSPTLVRKIVSENAVEIIKKGMRGTVEYGTGKSAAVEGYDIGGKTGTAEKLPRGNGKYLVSFIGAVPIDEPEILIYVVVDEANHPDQGNTGYGAVLAGDILEEILPYLQVAKKEE